MAISNLQNIYPIECNQLLEKKYMDLIPTFKNNDIRKEGRGGGGGGSGPIMYCQAVYILKYIQIKLYATS